MELLKSTGAPLGLLPRPDYEEGSLQIQAGDLVALYSDGVTEAWDTKENEFGESRLVDCLRAAREESSESIVERVFGAVDQFAGAAPQHDDITLMILKRTS